MTTRKRTQNEYRKMSHSQLANHFLTEMKKSKGKSTLNKISDFFSTHAWTWFYHYLRSRFGSRYPYAAYSGTETGIRRLSNDTVIALAADWATNTDESEAVAQRMGEHQPDYTLHLGDTYYVGAPHEIEANFIKKGAPWPRGKKGSYALLGNHEMYARGVAFFKKLLPALSQQAGFFCLENKYWRILGLDTGYHAVGKFPLIEMIPGLGPDCHFDPILVEWLRTVVKLNDPVDKRGLLILTHHQYITAFKTQTEFIVPAQQLAELIGQQRPVIWLWGHEHKFAIYENAQVGKGISAYGRCIGHGGMPVELKAPEFQRSKSNHGDRKLVMVDDRKRAISGKDDLGYNGYVVLELRQADLDISYYDTENKLLTESWKADLQTGQIDGLVKVPKNGALKTVNGKTWNDAVKA